jgi:hypothetical protein
MQIDHRPRTSQPWPRRCHFLFAHPRYEEAAALWSAGLHFENLVLLRNLGDGRDAQARHSSGFTLKYPSKLL